MGQIADRERPRRGLVSLGVERRRAAGAPPRKCTAALLAPRAARDMVGFNGHRRHGSERLSYQIRRIESVRRAIIA